MEKAASQDLRDFIKIVKPFTEKSVNGNKLRQAGFKIADTNDNRCCSLIGLETFIEYVLNENFEREQSDHIFKYFRCAFSYAFNAANFSDKQDDNYDGTNGVNFSGFRIFNAYLCIYATMRDAFHKITNEIDTNSNVKSSQERFDSMKWNQRCKSVIGYGFVAFGIIKDNNDAKSIFKNMDRVGRGNVLLEDWCDFVGKAEISKKTGLGKMLKGNFGLVKGLYSDSSQLSRSTNTTLIDKPEKVIPNLIAEARGSKNLQDFVRIFTPFTDKSSKGRELRKHSFKTAVTISDNQYCSLVELESFIQQVLIQEFEYIHGNLIFNEFRCSYVLAFHATSADETTGLRFAVFRIFNTYLCIYATMNDAFHEIKLSSPSENVACDNIVVIEDWLRNYKNVLSYKFVAFGAIKSKDAAELIFKDMDKDNNGRLSLVEWCQYITEADQRNKKSQALSHNINLDRKPKNDSLKKLNKESFMISGFFNIGNAATSELHDFVKTFRLYADRKTTGSELIGFKVVDLDGGYYCSYSELECFIQHTLSTEFNTDDGHNLFMIFRPIYIHAFNAVKNVDFDGEGIADIYMSFSMFRVFNVYLCIYATMYDAMCRINENNSSNRIDCNEIIEISHWLQYYKRVIDYGFISFDRINDEAEAGSVFKKMDTCGRGSVMLKEWCEYISAVETENETSLGMMLSGNFNDSENEKNQTTYNQESSSKREESIALQYKSAGSRTFTVGRGATEDLKCFVKTMKPYAAESSYGHNLRIQSYKIASANGNKCVDLDEIECFVLHALDMIFPNDLSDHLFENFRPSYTRAFDAALKAHDDDDIGEVHLTFPGFRIFIAYLCIDATMYDAFKKINTFDHNVEDGDEIIKLSQWQYGYKSIIGYGFKAFNNIDFETDAVKVFNSIDSDNNGTVSLTEWCEYIAAGEILQKTSKENEQSNIIDLNYGIENKESNKKNVSIISSSSQTNLEQFNLTRDVHSKTSEREKNCKSNDSDQSNNEKVMCDKLFAQGEIDAIITSEIDTVQLNTRWKVNDKALEQKNKFKSQIDIDRSKIDGTINDNSLDQISSEIKNTSIPSFNVDNQFIAGKDINDKEPISNIENISTSSVESGNNQLKIARNVCLGQSASNSLKKFITIFNPSDDSSMLRKVNFEDAFESGEQYCSLTKIENFIQCILNKELNSADGDELFKRFYTSYSYAFNAVKESVNTNDYLSYTNLEMFNQYLCFYVTIYDAFCTISICGKYDYHSKERSILYLEWLKNFKNVINYGLVAFHNIDNDKNAESIFKSMDRENVGKVSFKQWCGYIIAAEILGKTELSGIFFMVKA